MTVTLRRAFLFLQSKLIEIDVVKIAVLKQVFLSEMSRCTNITQLKESG